MIKLRDQNLLRQSCYVDGRWLAAAGGATLPVHHPAPGDTRGSVPNMGTTEQKAQL